MWIKYATWGRKQVMRIVVPYANNIFDLKVWYYWKGRVTVIIPHEYRSKIFNGKILANLTLKSVKGHDTAQLERVYYKGSA